MGGRPEDGNLRPDDLTKSGILCEREELQDYSTFIITISSSYCNTEQQIDTPAFSDYICKKCFIKCADTDQAIPCQDCRD